MSDDEINREEQADSTGLARIGQALQALPELRADAYADVRAWHAERVKLGAAYAAQDGEYLRRIRDTLTAGPNAGSGLWTRYVAACGLSMSTAQYRIARAEGHPYQQANTSNIGSDSLLEGATIEAMPGAPDWQAVEDDMAAQRRAIEGAAYWKAEIRRMNAAQRQVEDAERQAMQREQEEWTQRMQAAREAKRATPEPAAEPEPFGSAAQAAVWMADLRAFTAEMETLIARYKQPQIKAATTRYAPALYFRDSLRGAMRGLEAVHKRMQQAIEEFS